MVLQTGSAKVIMMLEWDGMPELDGMLTLELEYAGSSLSSRQCFEAGMPAQDITRVISGLTHHLSRLAPALCETR